MLFVDGRRCPLSVDCRPHSAVRARAAGLAQAASARASARAAERGRFATLPSPHEQAESLIAALHEASKSFEAEARETGRRVDGFGGLYGSLMTATEGTDEAPSDSEILSSAQEFAHRVRERAAERLTLEQMQTFDEIQAEQITDMQRLLRITAEARAGRR